MMGVQQAFGGIARMVGPLWAGAVFQGIGIRYPFWISAALMLGVSFLTRQLTDDKKAAAVAPVPAPASEIKAPAREGL